MTYERLTSIKKNSTTLKFRLDEEARLNDMWHWIHTLHSITNSRQYLDCKHVIVLKLPVQIYLVFLILKYTND